MRRFLPKSLQGQMLLSVALGLLVAQVLSGVLLFRAEERRQEARLVNSLAFQLVRDPQVDLRDGRPGRERRAHRRRIRIERALQSPLTSQEARDPAREAALRAVLEEQAIAIDELVVITRQTARDRYISRALQDRVSLGPNSRFDPDGKIVLAGLKRDGADEWLVARAPVPPRNVGAMRGVILQTLILYIVLVGGLAILLREITRPLAALTKRVERFGGTVDGGPRMEPSGPDDTRRLITAHNAMEARIAGLLDEKDVMLGAIGHDLKTPLAALRVRIESVEDDTERARMADTIEDITNSLDDILSLARVGRPSDPLERTELSALVASVVEEYEDMSEDVELGETQRVALPLRTTWLRRALRNLIGNALRYGGQARVSLSRTDTEAIVRIADNGPGIAEDQIALMLEPFSRGESSRSRETGGAGLGLTLARAIAEQHGGRLVVANHIGENGSIEGLVVELRLPI
ncbi:sensor histidine kinase [Aurantiacibacter rhizosphaerae]|uniref:histidine kinase n=1 Tax=Aurantiacibacter rhizosphaerae TaxID=2691582 RepID=A0A844X9V7_9SPHN|nr:ATP-binding protein [Aurantiacibacter rhizosphaerae]MWV26569.1 two-component sensor histidine kinase [Aurantiacibacter rhizosphaerae]